MRVEGTSPAILQAASGPSVVSSRYAMIFATPVSSPTSL
eukprot:CAMPEP_0202846044 /NCGR_PEP_ID=MMETSP1389-20130828/71595_1 /ASSEMBLY_ACC=CAM_ASM_000865 /TAXON_ID=302021 /ORGANISM="Rhodomonas sp., Strain CCMP768" /LENGTH=38 /DNA_ID= /DNA_START= /DNA_END= /DNA_ORIENTATION=